jgi:thioredoxin-dependent peroxiredoxin
MRLVAFVSVACVALAACGSVQRPDGGKGMLPVGAATPNVKGVDQKGVVHQLADERGHWAVVYFYPHDATPGCTKEACAFRDVWAKYTARGVSVLGVSSQDQGSHESFAKDNAIPFPIIADTDHTWASGFGVSSGIFGYSRVSFLVKPDGTIAKRYDDVDPGVHATQVLSDVPPN